jgi:hypothetical protein
MHGSGQDGKWGGLFHYSNAYQYGHAHGKPGQTYFVHTGFLT